MESSYIFFSICVAISYDFLVPIDSEERNMSALTKALP